MSKYKEIQNRLKEVNNKKLEEKLKEIEHRYFHETGKNLKLQWKNLVEDKEENLLWNLIN